MPHIGLLDFVKRQTPQSRYNHFNGSWEELITLVESQWEQRQVSPHNSGVMLVPMPAAKLPNFWSSIVPLNANSKLRAEYCPRVAGEAPFIQVEVLGEQKVQAQRAEIILYSHETLAKDGEAPSIRLADYYIVSINAYATAEIEPMSPMTMARNFLGLKGGTRPEKPYSAEEFAKALIYWNNHARIAGQ
jgi:hypothetical protein